MLGADVSNDHDDSQEQEENSGFGLSTRRASLRPDRTCAPGYRGVTE
jgi:hypothetical protein